MGLVILVAVITLKWLNLPDSTKGSLFQFMSVAALIGGIILGLMAYKALGGWVIKTWHLEEKLKEEVLIHFKSRKEYKEYYEKKQQR